MREHHPDLGLLPGRRNNLGSQAFYRPNHLQPLASIRSNHGNTELVDILPGRQKFEEPLLALEPDGLRPALADTNGDNVAVCINRLKGEICVPCPRDLDFLWPIVVVGGQRASDDGVYGQTDQCGRQECYIYL